MDEETKALTVNELIARLSALPDADRDLPVEMEGCDCTGACCGVSVERDFGDVDVVLLVRTGPNRAVTP